MGIMMIIHLAMNLVLKAVIKHFLALPIASPHSDGQASQANWGASAGLGNRATIQGNWSSSDGAQASGQLALTCWR